MSELRGKAHGCFCRKELCGSREPEAHKCKCHKYKYHFYDIALITVCYAGVDKGSNDERNCKLESRFQQLKEGRQKALFFISVQILIKSFHDVLQEKLL